MILLFIWLMPFAPMNTPVVPVKSVHIPVQIHTSNLYRELNNSYKAQLLIKRSA